MIKQVIVMRTELNMRKGKMIAQGSHASSKPFFDKFVPVEGRERTYTITLSKEMEEWMEGLYKKIAVGVKTEEELFEIYEKAKALGLPVTLIVDSGLTEFHGVSTNTCLSIGPALSVDIDKVTGHLKLL